MLHKIFVYAAFCFLLFGGTMHFSIDVVSQHLRKKRAPGVETTLYYGMHSAYALGQIMFGLIALLAIHAGAPGMTHFPELVLGLIAAAGWLLICLLFIEYREPRHILAVYTALLIGAVATIWI